MNQVYAACIFLAIVFVTVMYQIVKYIGKRNKKRKWDEYLSVKHGDKVRCIIDKQTIDCRVMRKQTIGYIATEGIDSFEFEFKHFVKKL